MENEVKNRAEALETESQNCQFIGYPRGQAIGNAIISRIPGIVQSTLHAVSHVLVSTTL